MISFGESGYEKTILIKKLKKSMSSFGRRGKTILKTEKNLFRRNLKK
jgi:hypothetical protein